jgi:hypothetical protein
MRRWIHESIIEDMQKRLVWWRLWWPRVVNPQKITCIALLAAIIAIQKSLNAHIYYFK